MKKLQLHFTEKARGRAKKLVIPGLFLFMFLGSRMGAAVFTRYSGSERTETEKTWEKAEERTGTGEVNVPVSSNFGRKELPIYCVEMKEKKIALSFDAAWGAEDFPKIMKILKKHHTRVTFFMTGGWVEQNPDCVRYLAKQGHDLGNHSLHHYDMAKISEAKQRQEIQAVHDKVKKLTGYEMFLFRPPYGSYNNSLIRTLYGMNYYPIQWSVDSLDWKDYGTQSIIHTVCGHKNLGPGAIILCHNAAKYTAEALDTMLTKLEQMGYQLVPISELILKDGYHMDVTGKQIPDKSN